MDSNQTVDGRPFSSDVSMNIAVADYPRQPLFNDQSNGPDTGTSKITWDDDASAQLRSTANPSGEFCDILSPCRRTLGLRKPPNLKYIPVDQVDGYKRPFGVIWFVRDPCGTICLLVTWSLMLYAEFVVSCVILARSPSTAFRWIAGICYHIFAFLAFVSHLKAFSTDPVSSAVLFVVVVVVVVVLLFYVNLCLLSADRIVIMVPMLVSHF